MTSQIIKLKNYSWNILLDYIALNTIKKHIDNFFLELRKDKTFYTVEIADKDFKEYEVLQFGLRL